MIHADLPSDSTDVDFHCLRHTFITMLARSGVHPKTAQRLARHSTMELTMAFYTHIGLDQEASAVEALAETVPQSVTPIGQRPTETDRNGTKSAEHPVACKCLINRKIA
jgi:hypothetical protein